MTSSNAQDSISDKPIFAESDENDEDLQTALRASLEEADVSKKRNSPRDVSKAFDFNYSHVGGGGSAGKSY